jgi:nucleoside phosphorylase
MYAASDGTEQAQGIVILVISAVNDAPVATADFYTTDKNSALVVDAGSGILVNDSDVDGDRLIATLVTAPQHGHVVLEFNGSLVYTPREDFVVEDTFVYDASNGQGAFAANRATVTAANTSPGSSVLVSAASALDGKLSDDGLLTPRGSVTTTWSKVSSPGDVTFGDGSTRLTTVRFDHAGTYALRFEANNEESISKDKRLLITVEDPTQSVISTATKFSVVTRIASNLNQVSPERIIPPKPSTGTDVVILTALDEELDIVLRYFPSKTRYMKGRQIRVGEYRGLRFALVACHGMGNVLAATVTSWALSNLEPEYVLMLGLAGGIPKNGERLLGDLVVPEIIVEYDHAKATPEGLQRRYQPFRPSRRLLELAREADKQDWAKRLLCKRPCGSASRIDPRPHFGVIHSGQQVVTDAHLVQELREVWPESVGLEMESAGVARALYEHYQSESLLIVKGISDWADPKKADDLWRAYAIHASAAFAQEILIGLSQVIEHDHPSTGLADDAKERRKRWPR